MTIRFYSKKKYVIEDKTIVPCNYNITKYFKQNSYKEFLQTILSYPEKSRHFYEFISEKQCVKPFFDIEIYKDKHPEFFNNDIIDIIESVVSKNFENISIQILTSHNSEKLSFHIIGNGYHFANVKLLKEWVLNIPEFTHYITEKIIDTSVYREGLFRTIFSTKTGEFRPLLPRDNSFDNSLDTFIGYILESSILIKQLEQSQNISEALDREVIYSFIRKVYHFKKTDVRDIIVDLQLNSIIVSLNDRYCYNLDREHKSNHQYIVIDSLSSKQKCHDQDCTGFIHNEVKMVNFPKELNELILRILKVNKHEQELIQKAIQECKNYINENFDEKLEEINFDRGEMIFKGNANNAVILKGQCVSCNLEHTIGTDGYCLRCKVCNTVFPKNQLIPISDKYTTLNRFWNNYTQLVNNGTLNINIYQGGEEDFNCKVNLDASIFKNKELTKICNQILDGHKVVLIGEFMSKIHSNFVYTNGEWYYFNDSIWKLDKESLQFRKKIVSLSSYFYQIKKHYESKMIGNGDNTHLIKNVNSLINKLHKTGFEDEIIKGAKMYYDDEDFLKYLNSKKHLVPFKNGVFDLLTNKFRESSKDDFINLICDFEFNPDVNNEDVYRFINCILPNSQVRDYVLKKMSECLNGDIPNTNFLMFIGDGANGKSQLLNLMKITMGELGEKVEVTLLTRKRNNANEANTEKIKLMNKRFAFLSEPEDGEKINISLLKELTGSEEVVARGLYQESVSFVMETKLFLACNELPEIKGEDSALWRRIRVIDFPSRFIDEPKESNEFKIDRTLPSRMREDISWRQTFMNILISYYYKEIKEPDIVKMKTNEYREENSEFYNWLNDNIIVKQDEILKLSDVCELYLGKKTNPRNMNKYKKEIEKWIKEKHPTQKWEYQHTFFNNIQYKGWLGFSHVGF